MNSQSPAKRRQAARDIVKMLRLAQNFMGCLAASEQQTIRTSMVSVVLTTARNKGLDLSSAFDDPDILEAIDQALKKAAAAGRATRREARRRNEERDTQIVRLRDKENYTFGEIPRELIKLNPRWCNSIGKPIARDTAEKAYYRMKHQLSDK